MRTTLALFVLLSFVSPAPFAECAITLDDEAIPEITRSGRASRRTLFRQAFPSRRFVNAAPRRAVFHGNPALRGEPPDSWTPRLFSRPPPR